MLQFNVSAFYTDRVLDEFEFHSDVFLSLQIEFLLIQC